MSGLEPPSCVITGYVSMGKLTARCFVLLPCKTKQTNKQNLTVRGLGKLRALSTESGREAHCAPGLLDLSGHLKAHPT